MDGETQHFKCKFETPNHFMDYREWDFVNTKNEILTVLLNSKQHGNSVGILSPQFGPDIFVTAVEDVILEGEGKTTIVFKPFDRNGYLLPSTYVDLSQIVSVCSFTSEFPNPYLDNLKKDKTWFF